MPADGGICASVGHATAFAGAPSVSRGFAGLGRNTNDMSAFAAIAIGGCSTGREMARSLVGVARRASRSRGSGARVARFAGIAAPTPISIQSVPLGRTRRLRAGQGRTIGVDVEDLSRRAPDPAIVTRYCSPAEAEDVCAQGDRWPNRFLTYWTLKEAYLKARGLGISVHLSDISFTLGDGPTHARIGFLESLAGTDDRWAFHLAELEPHHIAAVAVETTEANDAGIPALSFHSY
jgi:phosphopantetheinyl transferase (holo-ACP synthase)